MDENNQLDEVMIDELLVQVVAADCSELHLEVGKSPYMSRRGAAEIIALTRYEPARPAHIQRLLYDILSDEQIVTFEGELSLLFVYVASHRAKFGVFMARDLKDISATFHIMSLNAHGLTG